MPTIGQPGDPIEPVEVPLLLTGGSRWITAEPSRIAVGTLRMRSWQVFPVQPPPRVFDVHMDRWDLDRRRNWYQWAIEQVTKADFVLVIASPRCKQVADGHGDPKSNRGMQSEILLLMEQLHSDRETWSRKLLPVVLPGRSPDEIPLFLAPQTADHYLVQDFTVEGADDLLRAVTGQPAYLRPSVNPVVVRLPTRG
ncbi:SEFIR domain-containing protein [Nocardia amikacinitolerans]|uniref:SEFIR domain-containing protein n=1 Tax=Nocardia amikacinitolerans TaxID=756689 RepID=A0A285LHD0_9NOCA|nr:SEFIR domain-containing protein [Nocardia amikacinitolerans]SNY84365.1 SEFIR domain-containing protein [Nocardia amikacinitolerans]